MVLGLPFVFLNFLTGYFLNACNRQRQNTVNRGFMAGFTILLNIALIPSLTHLGAAITFLIANATVFVLDFWAVKRVIKITLGDFAINLTKIFTACILMVALLELLLPFVPWLMGCLMAGIIYIMCIMMTKVFSFSEIKNLLKYEKNTARNA
jgi:O-antigen/teichoic acid export membrane protein